MTETVIGAETGGEVAWTENTAIAAGAEVAVEAENVENAENETDEGTAAEVDLDRGRSILREGNKRGKDQAQKIGTTVGDLPNQILSRPARLHWSHPK